MKNVFILAVLFGGALLAQTGKGNLANSPEQRLEHLLVKLNKEQAQRVQLIQKEHHLKLKLVRSNSKQLRRETHVQIQALNKELNVKMRAILNKKQYVAYLGVLSRKQMNKKRPNKGSKRGSRSGRRGF